MAIVPKWQFILTDLKGVQLGELTGATDRSVSLPLMRVPTAQFTIPLTHVMAPYLDSGEGLLQCWRTGYNNSRELIFNGPIMGTSEKSDGLTQNIAVTCQGPFVRLMYRVLGKTKTGNRHVTSVGGSLGGLVSGIISVANTDEFPPVTADQLSPHFTGVIGNHAGSPTGAYDQTFKGKVCGEAVIEFVSAAGIEFSVTPVEPLITSPGIWPLLATVNVVATVGTNKSSTIILEYGTGKPSISGYEKMISNETLLTAGLISTPSWPESTDDLYIHVDAAAEIERGRWEGFVDHGGVTNIALRKTIVEYNVAVRKQGRQQIAVTLANNSSPSPITDFQLGDLVRARALVKESVRFDATVRIWGMTFNLDNEGNETTELQLVAS